MKNLAAFILCLLVCTFLYAQQKEVNMESGLPLDAKIRTGKLDNGLTYFIRLNEKPENRAQLWLVVNAGSILEDGDQPGLAHFTEHMAFNGTEHFAKQELVDYLESIGMQFGPEVNAYTGFDETVYMLQVPTDDQELMGKGFLILEDWADNISFEDEEIDEERGVVIEEWRLGRGAEGRMLDKQLPVIFKGSKYAERLPIGKKEVLETFGHETLKRFYRDWYRPDLMAVIAVGDFDQEWIEQKIRDHFSGLSHAGESRVRESFPVPDHQETLFALETDPEASYTVLSIYFMSEPFEAKTVGEYKILIMEQLFSRMFNLRLYELLNQPEPPFLASYAGRGDLVRSKATYSLNAAVKEDGIMKGLEALLTEAQRVNQYGFTEAELDRAKTKVLRQYEQSYNEREKTESSSYADEYSRHFLEGEPVPGIEYEYDLAKMLIPVISLDEVNRLMEKWINDNNRVVLVSTPETAVIPKESEMLALFKAVEGKVMTAYDDGFTDAPFMEKIPEPASITSEQKDDSLGLTKLTLSNGVKVVLKPTDFKNDEIIFQAFSPGGTSLVRTIDYIPADLAVDVIRESGLGKFGKTELNKKLSDKIVSVFPYVGELEEGFSGSSSTRDIETMFQLIYLYMKEPRIDSTGFLSFRSRMKGFIENRSADPESAFYDTLMVTMAQHHPRVRPWSEALLDEMDMQKSYTFYKDRFADASDFTFFFVGSFDIESLKPFITTYLGNLPSIHRSETWKDTGIDPPSGIVKREVYKGIEPKSRVSIIFTGPYSYTRENNYLLNSMTGVLEIKLREILREDKSGTYGVSISSSGILYPDQEYRINIGFGCDPDRVEEMVSNVFQVLDTLQKQGPAEAYIQKVSEMQKRSYEINLKENVFWLQSLNHAWYTGEDPLMILKYPELIETLTTRGIQEAANKYLDMNNFVQVVLLPEQKE